MGVHKSVQSYNRQFWRLYYVAGGFLFITGLHLTLKQQAQPGSNSSLHHQGMLAAAPPKLAIYNQVNIHLHVVAGAMHTLRSLTSGPITVFLPGEVLDGNLYGFMDWLGRLEGFQFKNCEHVEHAVEAKFDVVWFISPEWDTSAVARTAQQLSPRLALFYVHNGHMPDTDFNAIRRLSPGVPLLTMAPHVADYVSERLRDNKAAAGATTAEWVLPILPYQPQEPCTLQQMQAGNSCPAGFCIVGSTDPTLRNYTRMWEQIRSYRKRKGAESLANFKLSILGQIIDNFTVPDDLQQYVALHKTPSDPVFYEVNYHCNAIVPALANPAYYKSKLTSAVITSLMTGVPVIADSAFLSSYSMLGLSTVFHQSAGRPELDVMFDIAAKPASDIWEVREAVQRLRHKMNARATSLILGWMLDKGLVPDANSDISRIM